jgi:uncharacterized SAM-binding protein YcdF (DUF218 family)
MQSPRFFSDLLRVESLVVHLIKRILAWVLLGGTSFIILLYLTIPLSNTKRTRFDTIVVLGYPANPDGSPSPEQRERVLEGVRQYRTGIAPRVIMTGGAVQNRYVEAHVMAELAKAQGLPSDAVIEEGRAQNTAQNAYYSVRIMMSQGWQSAKVVSSPSHLPRASLIFHCFQIESSMKAAAWPPEYNWGHRMMLYGGEALKSAQLRLFGFGPAPFTNYHVPLALMLEGGSWALAVASPLMKESFDRGFVFSRNKRDVKGGRLVSPPVDFWQSAS